MKNLSLVILMTEENLYGREIVKTVLDNSLRVKAIVVERGSQLAKACKSYLKNDFYNPPLLKQIIENKGIEIFYTLNHNNGDCFKRLAAIKPDLILLGGTRILKDNIIKTAKFGVINTHPGLLPEYRGLDPILWAIYNRDDIGATCHLVDSGVDTGPILFRKIEKRRKGETLIQLRIRLMKVCVDLIIKAVKNFKKTGKFKSKKQSGQAHRYSAMPQDKLAEVYKLMEKI